MVKKKGKKKKIFKILIWLVVLALVIYILLNIRIKNIYVKGNNILSDQDIIELAGIENYPKLFSISFVKIQNRIKLSPIIKSVKVKKNIFGRVDIEVVEYNILLKDEVDNGIYLSNASKIIFDDSIVGIPSLINVVTDDILKIFIKKLDTIDKNILSKISEIEYVPSEYDRELFLFYMNDGNYVYINTIRLLNINKYDGMLEQLGNNKGILYLDSGNHFEILE